MKIHGILVTGILVSLSLTAAIGRASASEVVYDASGFVQGRQSFVQSFTATGPETLTVTLSNIAWPTQLSSLDVLVTNAQQGIIAPEMGAGTESIKITNGQYFVQWFGVAQGPLKLGVYGIDITSEPMTPVPLPASLVLFCSGLLFFVVHRRMRRTSSELISVVAG